MAGEFRDVKVVYRAKSGEQAWFVGVDPTAPLADVVPELIDALKIGGSAGDYDVRTEGTLDTPVIVLSPKGNKTIGDIRPAT